MSEPRKGDRVRVTYETEYAADGSIMPNCKFIENLAVEILERADDASEDPIGTVRKLHDGEPKHAVKHATMLSDKARTADAWTVVETGEVITNEDATHGDVIGAVPGTPAAEADQAAKRRAVARQAVADVVAKVNTCRVDETETKRRAFEGPGEKWLWYEVAPGHCITAATRKHAEDAWVDQYNQDRSYGATVDELLIDGYTEVSS